MSVSDDFFARVSDAAAETPLRVERTASGFDVTTDIVDATWVALLYKQGLRKVFTHSVDEAAGRYSITDDEYDVRWKAGVETQGGIPVPVLSKSAERNLGTVKKFESRKTFALNEEGEYDKVVDYTFSSEDGRRVIRDQASALGLTEKRNAVTTIGIAVAVAAVVLAVVAVVVVLALG